MAYRFIEKRNCVKHIRARRTAEANKLNESKAIVEETKTEAVKKAEPEVKEETVVRKSRKSSKSKKNN